MDSLSDILSNKDFSIPQEVIAIKDYVAKQYNKDIQVTISEKEIIISSRSAGLISSLRLNSPELYKVINTDKKIRLKIG